MFRYALLLAFQKQSLKWALERERVPEGIQSYFWSKIPLNSSKRDLYYCPILDRFRDDKPKVVRGGIIAEEQDPGGADEPDSAEGDFEPRRKMAPPRRQKNY